MIWYIVSDARAATVRGLVSFYLAATSNTSICSTRTLAIHKEKFNVPLRGDKCNFIKHFKTCTRLAQIAKRKGLRENPVIMIISSSLILSWFLALKGLEIVQEPACDQWENLVTKSLVTNLIWYISCTRTLIWLRTLLNACKKSHKWRAKTIEVKHKNF